MNGKGFTLIESLLVLFICSIFLMFPTLAIKKWQEVLIVEQFLTSVEKNILFTQQMSVVEQIDTKIFFSEEAQFIEFDIQGDRQENRKLVLPRNLLGRGPKKNIFKSISGNNSRLEKYEFDWQDKKQRIVFQFQMGSGKYIKKIIAI